MTVGTLRLVALCDLGDYVHLSPEELERHMAFTQKRLYLKCIVADQVHDLGELVSYVGHARAAEINPMPVLHFYARRLRQFRIRHKFYECF